MGARKARKQPTKEQLEQTLTELGMPGDAGAAPGSLEWAVAVRDILQQSLRDNQVSATRLKDMITLMNEHEGYRILHKESAETFQSLEDFCREKPPWGLGREPEEVEAIVQRRLDRQRRLEQVEADGRARNGANDRDSQGKFQSLSDSHHGDGDRGDRTGEAMKTRLRAIKERAPEIIRRLYEQDLIGVEAAASMGPLKPTERRQEIIAEVVEKLEQMPQPKSPQEKKIFKLEVNKMIYEKTEGQYFYIADDPVKAAQSLAKKFKGDRRSQLIDLLSQQPDS